MAHVGRMYNRIGKLWFAAFQWHLLSWSECWLEISVPKYDPFPNVAPVNTIENNYFLFRLSNKERRKCLCSCEKFYFRANCNFGQIFIKK